MQEQVKLGDSILFSLVDIVVSPPTPRMNAPVTISGKVKLFKIPFIGPIWIIATVTAPETWWEHYIPFWGSPEIRGSATVWGGNFEVEFAKGFDREGEYSLAVRAYAGPTMPIDKLTLPPFPPVSTDEATFTVSGEVPPAEEIAFSLTKPAVSPATTVEPGTAIKISCPVTSQCGKQQNITVKCIIYEGSILPGHGAKLGEYTSAVTSITPGQTKTFEFSRSTVAGTIDRRDVEVEVYIAGKLVKQSEWDDVYYVGQPPEEGIDFNLARPSVTPATITPGIAITITCPVTSACTKAQTPTAKVIIYEGSIMPGHGTKLAEYTSPAFTISPNQTYNVIVHHTAVAGSIDRRDIEVEVYIAGKLVKENEWDDVYYVSGAPPAPAQSPVVTTLSTQNITDKGATLLGKLVDTGYVSNVDVYFQFGKTTNYEMGNTQKARMYEGDEGSSFQVDISALTPNTTYHYRAAVDPVGSAPAEVETGYGSDMTFTTSAQAVTGFTMRVINPPAGAANWNAGYIASSALPQSGILPTAAIWQWPGAVPDTAQGFFIVLLGPQDPSTGGWPSVASMQWDSLLLRPGKNYTYNCATQQMIEA